MEEIQLKAIHVNYEITTCFKAAKILIENYDEIKLHKMNDNEVFAFESFLLHYSNLLEFFSDGPEIKFWSKSKTSIYAIHLVNNRYNWLNDIKPKIKEQFDNINNLIQVNEYRFPNRINKHLSYITIERIEYDTKIPNKWNVIELAKNLGIICKTFIDNCQNKCLYQDSIKAIDEVFQQKNIDYAKSLGSFDLQFPKNENIENHSVILGTPKFNKGKTFNE